MFSRRNLFTWGALIVLMFSTLGFAVAAQSPAKLDWANDAAWHEEGQNAVGAAAEASIGIGINSVTFPTTDAFQAAVRSSLQSDKAFPIFDWWSGYRMRDLIDAGVVADLSVVWNEHVAAGEYPQDLMDLFSVDGRAYGAPKLLNYWGVFYNKAVFDANGLSVPTTWDELMTAADILKAAGITPFGLDVVECRWCSFIWFEELLVRTDPQLYTDLVNGRVAYNDPAVSEVMDVWRDMIEKGYFSAPGEITGEQITEAFVSGSIGMYLIGDWWTANAERAGMAADQDFGFFTMPGRTPEQSRALIIEARPVLVAENSPQRDNALELLDFFMGTEGQTIWSVASGANSPNLKVAADTRPAHLVALSDAVAAGDYDLYLRFWEATPPEISETVVDLLGEFVVHPESQARILDQAAQIANDYWASNEPLQ